MSFWLWPILPTPLKGFFPSPAFQYCEVSSSLPFMGLFFSSYREASHFYLDSVIEEHDGVFSTRIFSPTSTRQLTAKFQYNLKLSQSSKI